jgi:methyl-accepting chemotaxis protein
MSVLTNTWDKFNRFSFKAKSATLAALLATLPVLGIGTIAYLLANNNLETTEREQQQYATEALKGNLIRFMILRKTDIQALSVSTVLTNAKVRAATPPQEIDRLLDDLIATHKFYDSIMVFDLQGNPLYASKNSPRDNHANRAYFQATIKTGQFQFSSPEVSRNSGKFVFHITYPIRDSASGKMVGVIRARMPLKALDVLGKAFTDTNNEWHIADRKANKFILAQEDSHIGRDTSDFASFEKLKNAEKATTAIDVDKVDGRKQLVSFVAVPGTAELPDLNLAVGIAKDIALIDAKERGLILVIALGMLATGGLTLGITLFLSDKITNYIQKVAQSIVESSSAIVSTVEMQEQTVNMQANSAIATTGTVNQLGSMSFQATEQAEASANGAKQALSLAEEGTRSVQKTIRDMQTLRSKVDAIAQQIVDLSDQTGQIASVSDLVADLANQTNMLALNAAVEAARAGEQGKGFAVVAGEIRKLADQSKESADRINALAEDIQTAINRTVMVTDEGTKKVKEGLELAQATAATFVGVTEAVNNVFLNSQQISASAKQQAVAVQQVLGAMTAISQGSQESAVGMHQVKMNTKELTQVADELKAAVV